MVKYLIYIGIAVRCFTQSLSGDNGYFIGVHTFDTIALFILQHDANGVHKNILMFFCGMAFYNLVKPLFENPTTDNVYDYYYFFAGLLFIFIQYVYQRFISGHRK